MSENVHFLMAFFSMNMQLDTYNERQPIADWANWSMRYGQILYLIDR